MADSSPTKKAAVWSIGCWETSTSTSMPGIVTDVWTTILIGRNVEQRAGQPAGMRQYLRRAFAKNIPYDRFMEELVTPLA